MAVVICFFIMILAAELLPGLNQLIVVHFPTAGFLK
jgi:hypothetical protein